MTISYRQLRSVVGLADQNPLLDTDPGELYEEGLEWLDGIRGSTAASR